MELFSSVADVPADFGPSAVTIGKFDGVHVGHRAVLDALVAQATARGLVPTVVTFDRNPLALLAPDRCPAPLVSNAQKAELLADAGVGATLMLAFDRALADKTPEEFVADILVNALHARLVLAGADFRFGAKGRGDFALLARLGAQHGFQVQVIDAVGSAGEERTSSTRIRELLDAGEVRAATQQLGRFPALRSTVVTGDQIGRELGFPTANLDPNLEGYVPLDGVYAAWATIDGVRYPAATSIGNNPTFDGVPEHQIEAHLIDQKLDAYGKTIQLEFVDRLRGMVKFPGIAELTAALAADVVEVRRILSD